MNKTSDFVLEENLVIVAIGCSAGGLVALQEFFSHVPENPKIAFIIAQHLSPNHETQLPQILKKSAPQSHLNFLIAKDGDIIEANSVYIIPAGHHGKVIDDTIRIEKVLYDSHKGPHLIDDLFCSMAKNHKGPMVGILLSGTGHDGTLGISSVQAHGGLTLAQEQKSAQFFEMAQNAIQNHLIDCVLPAKEMITEIQKFSQRRHAHGETVHLELSKVDLAKIYSLLKSGTGVDFSDYKTGTILRRTAKRLASAQKENAQDYIRLLETSPEEVVALYRDLLINVTGFFRDEENFQALTTTVFPKLQATQTSGQPIRFWVPACSTGEEVYTLAILLKEFMKSTQKKFDFCIFATDVDEQALKQGREGKYSECSMSAVPADILAHYFEIENGKYQVKKEIREKCVFARQDVTQDPPFSNMDVISCRNLFIYFNQKLQARILEIFHYALKPGRFLFLGASESISAESELFTALDKEHRIFSRSHSTRHRLPPSNLITSWDRNHALRQTFSFRPEAPKPRDLHSTVREILVSRFPGARVVINNLMNVIYTEGPIQEFIQLPSGLTNLNLLKMTKVALGLELRAAIQKSIEKQESIRRAGIIVTDENNEFKSVDLEIIPFKPDDADVQYFLILFNFTPVEISKPVEALNTKEILPVEYFRLEQELIATREFLHSVSEQQDSVTEELRSANEEIVLRNEELQSSNEELETTKEELQAGNEELTTLNDELAHRNNELLQLNNIVRESEEKFRSLAQSATDAIITSDNDGKIVHWNFGANTIFGYQEAEVIGQNVTLIVPPRFREAHMAGMKRVVAGGIPRVIGKTVEVDAIKKDGTEFPIELSLSTWKSGKATYFTSIIRDITEHRWNKSMQVARAEIGELLLAHHSLDHVIHHSLRIICEQIDFKFGAFWKYMPDSKKLTWQQMWPKKNGDYSELVKAQSALALAQDEGIPGAVWDQEPIWLDDINKDSRFIRKNLFAPTDVKTSITFPIGSGSDFFGVVEVFSSSSLKPQNKTFDLLKDIASAIHLFVQRKVAEDRNILLVNNLEALVVERTGRLSDSEKKYKFLSDASVLLASSSDYTITLQNIADLCVPFISDWCVVDIFTDSTIERVATAHSNPEKIAIANLLAKKYPPHFEERVGPPQVRRTGQAELVTHIPEELLVGAARDPEHLKILRELQLRSYICVPLKVGKTVIGAITLVYSESGRKYQTEDLALVDEIATRAALAADRVRLLQQAQSANKAKDEFLATLSHELRTPMNIILGWVEILRQDRSHETIETALEMLGRNSQIQIKLINDLLDISRIISGKLPVELRPLEISSLIKSTLNEMRTLAESKNISLSSTLENTETVILGDSVRLSQVMQNLINNAIKFTPSGGQIQVSMESTTEQVTIKIQDSGVGIDSGFLNHVFDSFRQEDGSTTRQYGGLGLGLAISRFLVTQHNGQIEVFSDGKNMGSTFVVRFPLHLGHRLSERTLPSAKPDYSNSEEISLAGKKILAIDDSPDILFLLERKLTKRKAQVHLAESAAEGFKYLEKNKYDVILCDIGMPKQDGISFIKELRTRPKELGGKTLAVAFTAYARKEEIDETLKAGFDSHLSKPATDFSLMAVLKSLLQS